MPLTLTSAGVALDGVRLPFAEQISFFRHKLALPSERWDDIERSAHDRAFIVAGATKADLVADLQAAVGQSIAEGKSIAWFRENFNAIVARHGWSGWTGEGTPGGYAWRTRVIYQTNMATSYAAGRWAQLNDPDLVSLRPYWKYHHADGVLHPRPWHVAWNGRVLPRDHPFWKTHFPPNGWGCHCFVSAASAADYTAAQAAGHAAPPEGWDAVSPKTGAPVGIDRGFDYAPGAAAATPLRDLIAQKLFKLDAPIGAAMWAELGPALALEQRLAMADLVDAAVATMQPAGEAALAHVASPATVADLAARAVPLVSADVWLRDSELIHALRDSKAGRGTALSAQTWRDLPELLETATPYLDTEDTALVYVFDAPEGLGKVAVRVNYTSKVQQGGKRDKLTSNFIRTGGTVETKSIENDARYVELGK